MLIGKGSMMVFHSPLFHDGTMFHAQFLLFDEKGLLTSLRQEFQRDASKTGLLYYLNIIHYIFRSFNS